MAVLLRVFLLFLLALVALRAVGRFLAGVSQGAAAGGGAPRGREREREAPVKMSQDPVCGTFVVPGKALSTTTGGTTVWFCSERCRDEYARRG